MGSSSELEASSPAFKGGLVASIKRLFKHNDKDAARRGSSGGIPLGSGTPADEEFAGLGPIRSSRAVTTSNVDMDLRYIDTSGLDSPTSPSPCASRRNLSARERACQLSNSASGPLAIHPVSVGQACLYHSLSSCSPPQSSRSSPLDAWPAAKGAHAQSAWAAATGPSPSSSPRTPPPHLGKWPSQGPPRDARLSSRSEASLPFLGPEAVRCSPEEAAHGVVSISAPSLSGNSGSPKRTLAAVVALPCVDAARAPAAAPAQQQQQQQQPQKQQQQQPSSRAAEADDAPAAAAASNSMLLAMCPGVPVAMRRKVWCLEDYEVQKRIYKSSTSAVYKAVCRRSGLPVALKIYFLSRVPANVVHMIVREIKIHVELVHKNVVMLHAAFQDERRLVLVQEYAARGDLYGIHKAMNRRMSEEQLSELVLAPFLEALAYLHAKAVCHRDIKPENILFTQDWRLVIADFGVSINLNQERAVTRAGTLEYMAPEVERCPLKMLPEENKDKQDLAYTTAVDIWAAGVLAYELLVGFPPFVADPAAGGGGQQGTAGAAFLSAHATRQTLSFPASASAAARDFISQALAERPEERPTARQLLHHPWLAATSCRVAANQTPSRRSSGQLSNLGSGSTTPLTPSRLGSSSLAAAAGRSASAVIPAALGATHTR